MNLVLQRNRDKVMADQWSNESNDIFERFAAGIDDAVSKGESLDCADRDLNYAIKLQHERLEHHGVTMKMNITPRGLWTEGFKLGRCQGDDHFEFYKETRTCKKVESYYKNGRRLYRNVDNYKLYQTVTDFATEVNPAERQYKCPSCGAISTVSQLVAGCPYCGTKFKTSEFYPKISNFYFNLDIGYKSGRTAKMCKWTIPISTAAIFTPFLGFALIIFLRSLQNTGVVHRATGIGGIFLAGLLVAGIFGPTFGYCIADWMSKLKYETNDARRNKMSTVYMGSRTIFKDYMEKISQEYSYEYFADKTVALIKMLIYSDKPEELTFYNGQALDPSFKNILNVSSLGEVGVTRMEVIGDYVVVNANVHLDNTYINGDRVRVVNDVLKVVMKKNITKPVNLGFNITSLHCPNCAGSYDATRTKICPHCGSANRIEDVDWALDYLGR